MRSISKFVALSLLVMGATSAQAQMSYTATGGNALVPEVVSSVDQADGAMLVRAMSHGFSWTNEQDVVGGNGSLECFGSILTSGDGMPLDGAGSCEGMDADGDVWWIWWNGGTEGEFGFTGGTGKYAGIDGGGTWSQTAAYPDGKTTSQWTGTWTIPAQDMDESGME